MTTYADLAAWAALGKPFRRLHYLWGDEYRLIEMAVDLLRNRPNVAETATITATGKNDGDVWSELNQYPASSKGRKVRHVIVRDAQLLRGFKQLQSWQAEMRSVTACLVGNERDFDAPLWRKARRCPRGHSIDDEAKVISASMYRREVRYCAECRAARKIVVSKGRLIRCGRPTTDRQKDELVNMIARRAGSSRGMATELLRQCAWSAGASMEALDKIQMMDLPLSEVSIKAAVVRSASIDFVDALRRGDRSVAAQTAPSVDPDSVPGILAACERWLGTAQRGMSAVRAGRTTQEIVRLLDVSWSEAEMMRRGAGKYTQASISRATEALAAADQVWYRERARVGVLEMMVSSW